MYTISTPSGTIRNDGVIVPQDDSKPEYLAYVAFLQLGGTPVQIADQEEPPARQHITVTARQMRKALISQGIHDQVNATVQGSGDPMLIADWEYATEFESDHPTILAMLPALGMNLEQMYALFETAKTM